MSWQHSLERNTKKAKMQQLDEVHLSYLTVALGIDFKWKSTSHQEPAVVPMKSL